MDGRKEGRKNYDGEDQPNLHKQLSEIRAPNISLKMKKASTFGSICDQGILNPIFN